MWILLKCRRKLKVYDCLNNFQKRMAFIAPIYLVSEKLGNRIKYKEYDMMNITFSVLCYLQEQTLAEDRGCDVVEIGAFIFNLVTRHYDNEEISIGHDEAVEMAKFIIEDVIESKGEMLKPVIQDFQNKITSKPTIKLVESEIEIGKRNKYKLTHHGIELLFRTDEVDKEMKIDMGTLILKKAITSGNYDKAVLKIKELVNIARQLRIEIEELINNIRLKVEEIIIDYIKELQAKLNIQFNEQYNEFNSILKLVSERKRNINIDMIGKSDTEIEEASNKIDFIRNKLDIIIFEYSLILSKKQNIYHIYSEELDNAMAVGFGNNFDFTNIKRELEKRVYDGEIILALFKPLLNFKFQRRFNLSKVFSPQLLIVEKEVSDDEYNENSLSMKGTVINERDKRIKEKNDTYVHIVFTLLHNLAKLKGQWMTLSEFLRNIKKREEDYYNGLIIRDFFVTILMIYSNPQSALLVKENYIEFKGNRVAPDEEFREVYVVGKVCEMDETLKTLERLELKKIGSEVMDIDSKFKFMDIEMRVI
jgi:hypothetical protein